MEKQEKIDYTLLKNFRYERKFRPESLSLFQIRNTILSSKAFFRKIYYPRYINNIYLDTPELDAFHDNIGGKSERRKYRIRWYGEKNGNISGAIFEIKIKSAFRGTKQSFFLPDFTLDSNFSTIKCFDILKKSEMPLEILDEVAGMEMKILNRYERTYYRDISGRFRLTTDSNIQYFKIHDNFNSFVDTFSDDQVIVEIKYDEEHNEAAAGVINTLPFRMTRNSKYVDGIARFYEVPL